MLAILTSHPIQYQVPIWRALAATDVPFQVWYLTRHGVSESHDTEFGRQFAWDIDMLGGYESCFLDVGPSWDLRRFRGVRLHERLADRLQRQNVRALWIEGWRFQANWQAVRAASVAGVPIWLRGDSNDLKHDGYLKSFVKRPLLSRFFDQVSDFLCVGSANRRLYESYGVPLSKLHAAPHCVDNDRFHTVAEMLRPERDAIRERWGIPADGYCVLFCGKFVAKKRPLDVVAAARALSGSAHRKQIHLLFVGTGALGGELRGACSVVFDADAGGSVKMLDADKPEEKPGASFVGFLNQTEIASAYVAADLLVLPSDSGETWGLVANEAMACGTPVVASNLCGCAEDLVGRQGARYVFRCGDVADLATAIQHACEKSIPAEEIQRIASTHHVRHTVTTVARLYKAISAAGFSSWQDTSPAQFKT